MHERKGFNLNNIRKIRTVILTLLCLWLVACSTVKKDGPPSHNVDVSGIPDAQPKVESLSKTGNKTYEVFGKRYYVMRSSKNYQERGVASWYGSKFHKRKTSSGERYNMLAMTAAHKTLPLPTYVQVRNLNNGKIVVVKVNDRGPFESNRIIDLSYAAAKKLGIVGSGTAKVEVTAIDPRDYYFREKAYTPVYVAKNSWHKTTESKQNTYLQIGAFRNKAYAQRLKSQIQAVVNSPVYITELNRAQKLYRVQIGPIKDQTSVSKINKKLSSIGLNGKRLLA